MIMNSKAGQAMLAMLPPYYSDDRIFCAIIDSIGVEIDYIMELYLFIAQQFATSSASGWGLTRWERDLDITYKPRDIDDIRRSRVVAKLRGIGTVTASKIQEVAKSYINANVAVIDRSSQYTYDIYRETTVDLYTFIIRFVNTAGIPPNIDDLKATIEEIKPAHIEVIYAYNYLVWYALEAQNLTWTALEAKNLTWAELESGAWVTE